MKKTRRQNAKEVNQQEIIEKLNNHKEMQTQNGFLVNNKVNNKVNACMNMITIK